MQVNSSGPDATQPPVSPAQKAQPQATDKVIKDSQAFRRQLKDVEVRPTQTFRRTERNTFQSYEAKPEPGQSTSKEDDPSNQSDQQSDVNPQPQTPEGSALQNMLGLSSKNAQLVLLTAPGVTLAPGVDPIPAMTAISDQIVAHVEKVDKTTFNFRIQGLDLEIRVSRDEQQLRIVVAASKELSAELADNYRLPLSDLLKSKFEAYEVSLDFETLAQEFGDDQGQDGQQGGNSEDESGDDTN